MQTNLRVKSNFYKITILSFYTKYIYFTIYASVLIKNDVNFNRREITAYLTHFCGRREGVET